MMSRETVWQFAQMVSSKLDRSVETLPPLLGQLPLIFISGTLNLSDGLSAPIVTMDHPV